jgi:hypothetical protein
LSIRTACASSGIGETTYSRWVSEDLGFANACARARASGIVSHARILKDAAEKDWRASAWWLERRSPEQFGPRSRVGLTVELDHVPSEKKVDTSPEFMAEVVRIASLNPSVIPGYTTRVATSSRGANTSEPEAARRSEDEPRVYRE